MIFHYGNLYSQFKKTTHTHFNNNSFFLLQIPKYRVVLLGDAGVGKTALVSQFMTSEYMNTYDASLGEPLHIPNITEILRTLPNTLFFYRPFFYDKTFSVLCGPGTSSYLMSLKNFFITTNFSLFPFKKYF